MSTSASKGLQEAANISANDVSRSTVAATDENLACQWDKCLERCTSAEALFEHICEKHVGRKSTNNLNLTCRWASCRTTTVKRDHITSHIRVHVPLKPHKCDFCGKAFKRPQDLKKHVKTHADDSVLLRSSDVDARMNARGITKVIESVNYQGTYYDQNISSQGSHASYGTVHHPVQNSYYAPHQQAPYGPVYYPNNHGADASNNHSTYESRKRGFETLNEFFGDAKRRQIDPTSYAQVGQRLMALHDLPIHQGVISDHIAPGSSLVSVDSTNGGSHATLPSHHQYALPLPNLRTKTDLMNIDQFLEQMQSTVYESSNAAAAAGVHQPGTHYTHAGVNFRQSHSPPQTSLHHLNQMSSSLSSQHNSAQMISCHQSSQSNASNTPALTPSSSNISYTSSHSPVSSHGMSPIARDSSITSTTYPNIPTATLNFSSHSTTAPISTLGTNFDNDLRRKYSGGMLQQSSNSNFTNEEITSAEPSPISSPYAKANQNVSVIRNIDSALSEVNSPKESSESEDSVRERAEEMWIENIRVIEALRSLVSRRLQRKEYEVGDEDVSMTGTEPKKPKFQEDYSDNLYPMLRVDDN